MTLASSDHEIDREKMYLRLFEQNGVQGVLCVPSSSDLDQLRQLRARGINSVLVDACQLQTAPTPREGANPPAEKANDASIPTSLHESVAAVEFSSVSVNNFQGGYEAAATLLHGDATQLAFINGPHTLHQCRERLAGARAAAIDRGLDPDLAVEEFVVHDMNAASGALTFAQIAARGNASGIMCINDLVALGVSKAARSLGLSIPDDYRVVGYDDLDFAAELLTPLTTIRQPNYEIGRRAADILLTEIQDPSAPQVAEQFIPELIQRESSGV
jgi:LacI family transcriptional regulator